MHGERPILLRQITAEVSLLIAMASHASQQFAGIVRDGVSTAAILIFPRSQYSDAGIGSHDTKAQLGCGSVFRDECIDIDNAGQQSLGVIYPNILIAANDPANSLTVTNATAGAYGMQIGLWWFLVGFILFIAYQACAHQAFRGKVKLGEH